MDGTLTHLDASGNARMVDVSAKDETARWARARAVVRMSPEAAARVAAGDAPKGDVITVARLAAIQAAKRTDELIPLAHQLPLTHVDPAITVDPEAGTVTIIAEARTAARTGVEMEAMVACSVGALAVYDMVKGIEPGVVIEQVLLLDKTGGKSRLPPMKAERPQTRFDGHRPRHRRRPHLGHRPLQLPLPVLHARRGPAVAGSRRHPQLRGDRAALVAAGEHGRARHPPDRRRAARAPRAVEARRAA